MRTIILIVALMTSVYGLAQTNPMETRNRLQRELQSPESNWMTRYNLAYIDIAITFGSKEEVLKNRLLEEAGNYLLALETLKEADPSEIEALKAFRFLALMNMNPAVNGPKYGASITAALAKSLKQNPDNPRAVIISALYQKNMAAFMNKEYANYQQEIERAKALLQRQDSTRLAPVWGVNLCGDK